MPAEPSFAVTLSFLLLVVWAVASSIWALRRSGAVPSGARLGVGGALWLGVPAALAASGLLGRFEVLPPPMLVMMFPLACLTLVLAFGRLGTALGAGLSLAALVGLQIFRFPLELVLHRLYVEGVLPVEMTYAGGNFDILSGLGALALWLWAKRAPVPRSLLWIWAVGGLLLLLNIVTTAVLAFPAPFGWYEPANRIVATWPWVWLPTVHVQLALFGHVVVLRRLWGTRGGEAQTNDGRCLDPSLHDAQ